MDNLGIPQRNGVNIYLNKPTLLKIFHYYYMVKTQLSQSNKSGVTDKVDRLALHISFGAMACVTTYRD